MNKQTFLEVFNGTIKRPGADRLLAWLETTDFFTAPASTKHHLSHEGGLVEHSLNVHKRLVGLLECLYMRELSDAELETAAICGLLHDVCKANFYKTEMRNTKDENGQWVKVPYYAVDDQLPYGHGEKSVYIISGFMKLTREEAMAIRWHMGGFESQSPFGSAMSRAYEMFPLAVMLHMADLWATFIDESS